MIRQKRCESEYREVQKKYEKLATVKDVVDHIDHVVQVIGIDYVGIGTDFDGGGGVEGCRTAAEMKNITIELLRRGYSKSDITKIWGGNIMRVLRKVEETARQRLVVMLTLASDLKTGNRYPLFRLLLLKISESSASSREEIYLDLFF